MQSNSNEHITKNNRRSIRERIADTVDISKDVILNSSFIRITGVSEVIIENYKGILEYSDKRIRIRTNPKTIEINGNYLEIRTITDELLYISGEISCIAFTEE